MEPDTGKVLFEGQDLADYPLAKSAGFPDELGHGKDRSGRTDLVVRHVEDLITHLPGRDVSGVSDPLITLREDEELDEVVEPGAVLGEVLPFDDHDDLDPLRVSPEEVLDGLGGGVRPPLRHE